MTHQTYDWGSFFLEEEIKILENDDNDDSEISDEQKKILKPQSRV